MHTGPVPSLNSLSLRSLPAETGTCRNLRTIINALQDTLGNELEHVLKKRSEYEYGLIDKVMSHKQANKHASIEVTNEQDWLGSHRDDSQR